MVSSKLLRKMTIRADFLLCFAPHGRRCSSRRESPPSSEKTKPCQMSIEVRQRLSREEVLDWGKSFKALIASKDGRNIFREFLKKEYSQENILFYEACEELGELTDEQAVFEKARSIYEDFISSWSPREVSLDSVIKDEIQERMINPDKDMYKNALDHIYNLMMRDSYPRFKMSEIYRTALEESGHFE